MIMLLKKYPRGVISLSSIEMWERFSFYTMQSLLVLYAAAKVSDGGLGWSNTDALLLTGYYGAFVYVSPIIGGIIADKIIGRKLSVFLGAVIMMFGHASLALPGETMLYVGIALLITGCGLLKPTISAMVGEFFKENETSAKESAFAIFYMSINIGGFIGPMLGGYVQQEKGFSWAFSMAAFGLLLGIINFLFAKNKSLKGIGERKPSQVKKDKLPWTRNEKIKVALYLGLCVSNIFWNVIYALPYGLLTLYADKNIDRHIGSFIIPPTWYFGMYGLLIIIYSPLVAIFYRKFKTKVGSDMTLGTKLGVGYILIVGGCFVLLPLVKNIALNPHYVGSSWYLIGFYTLFALSELLTVPVLLSAATTFAPHGYSATLVSLNMAISWAIGAWLGGVFGAMTQQYNPTLVFEYTIALSVIFAIGHIVTKNVVERVMHSK